jgi:multisubunit Na+/H+ antiporter MnhG subunit
MTPRKLGGVILIVLGLLIILMGLSVEMYGMGGNDGIGWVQLLVAFAGVIFVIGGVDVYRTPDTY